MIFTRIDRTVGAFAAASVLGFALLASPLSASAAEQLAQASPPSAAAPAAAAPTAAAQPNQKQRLARNDPARVEKFLDNLHRRLHITQSEEPQWNAYAQAVKDDAAAMLQNAQDRQQATGPMTATDVVHAYQKGIQAHADGLNKIVPAFDALYNSMSDPQKKQADAFFSRMGKPRASKKKSAG